MPQPKPQPQPVTKEEVRRRKQSHAVALTAMAAMNRYVVDLPEDLTKEQRAAKLEVFVRGAGSVYIDELAAIGAYGGVKEGYDDDVPTFIRTIASFAIAELTFILAPEVFAALLYDVTGDDLLKKHVLYGIDRGSKVIQLGQFKEE